MNDINSHEQVISALYTGRHLPYRITQCYLPPDTSELAPTNPSQTGWYSINLPRREGSVSWHGWVGTETVTAAVKQLNDIALLNKSSQSYGESLTLWDHTPATRHK